MEQHKGLGPGESSQQRSPAVELLERLVAERGQRWKEELDAVSNSLSSRLEFLRTALEHMDVRSLEEPLEQAMRSRREPELIAALFAEHREAIERGRADAGVTPQEVTAVLSRVLGADPARWEPGELLSGGFGHQRWQGKYEQLDDRAPERSDV
jgi:hypothetical protein